MTDKLQVFPSRANAVLMKQKILAAKRGANLLKRKRDAIDMKLREIRAQMADKEEVVDKMMREAIFSVTKANLLGTDFKPVIVADSRVGTTYMHRRQQKLVGITLNFFELEVDAHGAFPLAGLSCGGQQVQRVRHNFQEALKEIVQYASYEYMLRMMVLASRQTNMRVNALDFVVIPKLINTSHYIDGELEELEREDFYRLKRSQAKQLEAKIAFTELIKTKNMTGEELAAYTKRGGKAHPVADVFFDEDDFDKENVDERMRRQYREHQMQNRQSFVKLQESDDDEEQEPTSRKDQQDRQAHSTFSQRTVQRDPRASRASFYSLPSRTFKQEYSSSSSSNTASSEKASDADDAAANQDAPDGDVDVSKDAFVEEVFSDIKDDDDYAATAHKNSPNENAFDEDVFSETFSNDDEASKQDSPNKDASDEDVFKDSKGDDSPKRDAKDNKSKH